MVYKLKLLSLHCYLSDESDGDEIYILMNGTKIWPLEERYKTIKEEVTDLMVSFDINKGDHIEFELWDHDKLSSNDLLGKLNIIASAHGQFSTEFVKTGTDLSKYALNWELG